MKALWNRTIMIAIGLSAATMLSAQKQKPSDQLLEINRRADEAVVAKDLNALKLIYAEDFVFTHGTGLVDSKDSWLKSVGSAEGSWIQRRQDSTAVEIHGNVGIVTGSISIVRAVGETRSGYGIRYVRVFSYLQKRWQMISHRTVREWRE